MKNKKRAIQKIALNCLRLCVCAAGLAFLSGCTSPRSPEVRGWVLDAQTRIPVESAVVYFYDHPSKATKTDAQGYFYFKATQNFHLLRLPPGDGAWPRGTYFDKVVVCHPNYLTNKFYGLGHSGDILIEPKQ
jgi:hypothetical protein